MRRGLVLAALVATAACASAPPAGPSKAPTFPAIATPVIPKTLTVSADVRQRSETAWLRVQAGDMRGATRDYTEILKMTPSFYPAEVGLGYVALAGRKHADAIQRFRFALSRDPRYLPAWRGLARRRRASS